MKKQKSYRKHGDVRIAKINITEGLFKYLQELNNDITSYIWDINYQFFTSTKEPELNQFFYESYTDVVKDSEEGYQKYNMVLNMPYNVSHFTYTIKVKLSRTIKYCSIENTQAIILSIYEKYLKENPLGEISFSQFVKHKNNMNCKEYKSAY